MAHANARLTPAGRLTLVERIAAQPRRPLPPSGASVTWFFLIGN